MRPAASWCLRRWLLLQRACQARGFVWRPSRGKVQPRSLHGGGPPQHMGRPAASPQHLLRQRLANRLALQSLCSVGYYRNQGMSCHRVSYMKWRGLGVMLNCRAGSDGRGAAAGAQEERERSRVRQGACIPRRLDLDVLEDHFAVTQVQIRAGQSATCALTGTPAPRPLQTGTSGGRSRR